MRGRSVERCGLFCAGRDMSQTSDAVEHLQAWCRENDIVWHERATERFEQYIDLILRYQKQTNLTGFSTASGLVDNMIVDSLQIVRVMTPVGPLVDVGSGAGFPAMPLKILFPDVEMHLVEPRTKRYAFLGLVVRSLGLDRISVHGERIENAGIKSVRTAISKAFAPPAVWLETCLAWARDGAQVAGYFSLSDYEALLGSLDEKGWCVKAKYQQEQRVYALLVQQNHE